MMARWPLLASTALVLVGVTAARADPMSLQPPAPAAPQGAPLDFVVRLLGGKTLSGGSAPAPAPVVVPAPVTSPAKAPVVAAKLPLAAPGIRAVATKAAPVAAPAEPMSLTPPGATAALAPPAPRHLAAAVPLPRPRPAYHPSVAVAGVAAPMAGIDATATTGSIEMLRPEPKPETMPAVAKPAEPMPATIALVPPPPAAPAPEPPPLAAAETNIVAESDGLLGDPSSFDLNRPEGLVPDAPTPSGIDVAAPPGVLLDAGVKGTVEATTAEPYELVRSLQLLQDRMADGDVRALAAQQPLRAQIDHAFAGASAATWNDPRNANAAVTYALSGGSPEILKRLQTIAPGSAVDGNLVSGVLAYADGDPKSATPLLAGIDLAALPPSMAGQVAIAQSALAVQSDPARAMKLLGLARLFAPGTLVEEAALRRQLFVADQQRDDDAIQSLARQYLDRFRNSVYAGNFRARFAAALSHMRSIDSEDKFSRLDDMLAMVEPDARCELYLTVALASTINNRLTAAKLAAERASGLALGGSVQEARARLYHAAALAALPKLADKAAADLGGVRREQLPAADRTLFDMVAATIKGVQSGTDRASITVAAAEPLGDGSTPADDPVLARARKALADTDALIAVATSAPNPDAPAASSP